MTRSVCRMRECVVRRPSTDGARRPPSQPSVCLLACPVHSPLCCTVPRPSPALFLFLLLQLRGGRSGAAEQHDRGPGEAGVGSPPLDWTIRPVGAPWVQVGVSVPLCRQAAEAAAHCTRPALA